jgi:hypothetical protein
VLGAPRRQAQRARRSTWTQERQPSMAASTIGAETAWPWRPRSSTSAPTNYQLSTTTVAAACRVGSGSRGVPLKKVGSLFCRCLASFARVYWLALRLTFVAQIAISLPAMDPSDPTPSAREGGPVCRQSEILKLFRVVARWPSRMTLPTV